MISCTLFVDIHCLIICNIFKQMFIQIHYIYGFQGIMLTWVKIDVHIPQVIQI